MISVERFEDLRPYLFSIAYRMLGSASDAEDVLQDAWLRSHKAPEELDSDRAWLAAVVTRLCLDRLKSARATREQYVGPWLPEPVPTEALPVPEQTMMQRESVTVAFLVLLERLSPAERGAFLLREVFDYAYGDVARILEVTEAAARQLVHRAKERIAQGKRRFDVEPDKQREAVQRFLAAAEQGDLPSLEALLASGATYTADGGGRVAAARRVVEGPHAIALIFANFARIARSEPGAWRGELDELNGEPAFLAYHNGTLDAVFVFTIEDGRIASIHVVRNPEKLAWLKRQMGDAAASGVH